MKSILVYILIFSTIILSGCINAPDFSDTPSLTFIGFDKSSMVQGDLNTDSITIVIDFTDGNGDIGSKSNSSDINLFIFDNRNGEIYDNIKLPEIPQEGAFNGVKGTIRLKLYNGCCLFDDKPNCTIVPTESNQLSFDIYLIDQGGNQSNTITTSDIELICS